MILSQKSYTLTKIILILGLIFNFNSSLIGQEDKDFVVTDAMRTESRYVVQALERTHYNRKPIAQLNTSEFINDYLNDLDLNHLFLLQEEVNEIHTRFDTTMITFLKQGNIFPAFEIFKIFRKDFRSRIEWVMKRLETPFDFSDHSTFIPTRKDLPWPKSLAEADDLWEKRLKFELLNEILIDPVEEKDKIAKVATTEPKPLITPTFEESLKTATSNVRKRYERLKESIEEIDTSEVQEIFLTSLAEMYDSHSSYYSAESLEEFSMMLSNSLVGIGASLSLEDNYCTIKELIAGGPAERSKELKPNDRILAVAQGDKEFVDIIGMKIRKAVGMIRGDRGTLVRLLIRPADGDPDDRKIISLIRDEIRLTSNLAEAKIYEIKKDNNTLKIGIIEVPSFYAPSDSKSNEPSTTRDVKELVLKLKKMGMQGLILDLRYNGGGLLSEAISLTGLFMPMGPVVHVRDAQGQIREFIDTSPDIIWKGPLAILSSKFSASASEIFAGALKNYRRALIIGDTSTHGKGTVQLLSEISRPLNVSLWNKSTPKMGATKFTIQKWYLPDGSSIQLKGVPSDIVIPSINELLPIAEADLPNALAWDSIHTIPWTDESTEKYTNTVHNEILNALHALSLKRQASLEEFSYLKETIDHFKQRQDQKEFSLNLDLRKNEKTNDTNFRKAMETRLDELSKHKFEVLDVKLDSVTKEPELPTTQLKDILNENAESETKNTLAKFDIYKREGLRIMSDYINFQIEKDPKRLQEQIAE